MDRRLSPFLLRLDLRAPALAAAAACLAALVLAGVVRRAPLALAALIYLDALAAFFVVALCAGMLLRAVAVPAEPFAPPRRLIGFGLLLGAIITPLALPAAGMLLLGMLAITAPDRRPARLVALLSAGALVAAAGILALRGVFAFSDPLAGAALDGSLFGLILLAAVLPLLLQAAAPAEQAPDQAIAQIIWLFPLARLYTISPWNEGWSFAAILLGTAIMLWAAIGTLRGSAATHRHTQLHSGMLGMALSGIGLASGAGIAAACAAIGAWLISVAATDEAHPAAGASISPPLTRWLLSGAFPLSAPFVATWMLVGATIAGGLSLLAALSWIAMLLHAVAVMASPPPVGRRRLVVCAAASLAAGILTPPLTMALVQPVIEQLQGGLTVYGDTAIRPWVGIALIDSARREVTVLPSLALAGLMLVLSALVYLLARLRGIPNTRGVDNASHDSAALLEALHTAVPWLSILIKPRNRHERR
ncbi:MAG TPA: hypothetical protein PKC19_10815 [Roseiflexaceae bacterium]|nr:hypothetical protein [Roseiflexaceae bacterium]